MTHKRGDQERTPEVPEVDQLLLNGRLKNGQRKGEREEWGGFVGDLRREEKERSSYVSQREVNGFYGTLTLTVFLRN